MKNLSALIVKTIDNKRTVKFCNVIMAEFDVISDDYAYTHATDWAKLFTEAWWDNDRLPMDERVNASSNYAFANLDDSDLHKPTDD